MRSEARIVKRAVYIALGIDLEGKKDVIGMYVGENEGAKFWLSIINGLKNRGIHAVSYTHLDVYKRQIIRRYFYCRLKFLKITAADLMSTKPGSMPVSALRIPLNVQSINLSLIHI